MVTYASRQFPLRINISNATIIHVQLKYEPQEFFVDACEAVFPFFFPAAVILLNCCPLLENDSARKK